MSAFTLRFQPVSDDAQCNATEAAIREFGARISWQHTAACERTYGLVEGGGAACASAARKATRALVFDRPVIALAVYPSLPEALPALLHAVGGPGRPTGVFSCDPCAGGLIVEWDLDVTPLETVMNVLDVELERFHARRVNALLTPLPVAWWTRIAADGLRAPEITPDRVLEEQLEVQHVLG
ncbi:MAG TPA: hypothetical protein VMD47_07055 [Candidatus Acidoferrales bacterium]|nr:hypothetical protein [Candidatus Acidoferrales bacterium]